MYENQAIVFQLLILHLPFTSNRLNSPASLERRPESPQSIRGQYTQQHGQRLSASPDSARNRASGKDNGSEQGHLDAVGSTVADAVAAEEVLAGVLVCFSSGIRPKCQGGF